MANWSVLYGDIERSISDRQPFDVVSVSGVGTAPIRQLEERAPVQDGATNIGFRLDPRTVNLVLFINATSKALVDSYRDELYEFFKGLPSAVKLRCVRDDGATRQLDCYTTGMLDAPFDDENKIGKSQRLAVQLRAPDPVWYDPEPKTWAVLGGSATGLSGFEVPMLVPWQQSALTAIDTVTSLQYAGSWAEYPVITIFGPGTNFKIENQTTGDILHFPSLTLTAGQYVTVDLRYGSKTVVDQADANKISYLSSDSDLATWRIVPAPFASGGSNILRVIVASDATDSTGFRLSYYNRFIGL